ncbi:hypothetical protein G6F35_009385 [Rhizopus arrhizus]|nr:hypothetical protein G6F35_009385 [Rhizopus arrhizus]
MLNVFKGDQQEQRYEQDENKEEEENALRLLSVGSLSISKDVESASEPLLTVDVSSYREKRRRIEQELPTLSRSLFLTTAPVDRTTEETVEMTEAEKRSKEETAASEIVPQPYRNEWFAEKDTVRKTDEKSTNIRIYEYLPQMVPIFATAEQAEECDKIAAAAKRTEATFYLSDFRKSIDCLNFTLSDYDNHAKDVWKISGKLQFLKEFLDHLKNEDLVIMVLTEGMNEETCMYDFIREDLGFACTRIGNVFDDEWDGEYGVFIKTKKSEENLRLSESGLFKPLADLVLCMDITIESDLRTFLSLKRNDTEKPHVLWLVTIGSLEERAFKFLRESKLTFSKCGERSKTLLLEDNQWPVRSDKESMMNNRLAALNLASWLIDYKGAFEYQYRSTIQLPHSQFQATAKPFEQPLGF